MDEISVHTGILRGRVMLPPFKSEAIRYCLLCALSGTSPIAKLHLTGNMIPTISMVPIDNTIPTGSAVSTESTAPYSYDSTPVLHPFCDDILYAISASAALDESHLNPSGAIVKSGLNSAGVDGIYVGGSATLLRLMIPPMLAKFGFARFHTDAALFKRMLFKRTPLTGGLDPYVECLKCEARYLNDNIIEVSGGIQPNTEYRIRASESSQFASGLLLALPLVQGMSIRIEGEPVSSPYFTLTLKMLRAFGVTIDLDKSGAYQALSSVFCAPGEYKIEGDHSYAANFLAAGFIAPKCNIELIGYDPNSLQADTVASKLFGRDVISISNCPDLFPILCVSACARRTSTVITNIGRLRGKESDRVEAMRQNIMALGGKMEVYPDHTVIPGSGRLRGGFAEAYDDHRVVMAMAMASLICEEPVIIRGYKAVSKSAPQFFNDFKKLGGIANEYVRK